MSVSLTDTKVQFNGDAVSSAFPFNNFQVYAASELIVSIKNNTTGIISGIAAKTIIQLVLNTDYTVTLNGSTSGVAYTGTVTLTNPLYTSLPVGLILIIQRVLPETQLTTLADNNKTPASTFQQAFDRSIMLIQQLQELINRSVVFDITQVSSPTLPPLSPGALYTDGVNLIWQALVTTATTFNGSFKSGADAAKSATPAAGDIYFATDTRKIYFCSTINVWAYGFTFDINTVNGTVFAQQGSGIVTGANQIGLYTKAVSGQPELFYRLASNGTEIQLTKNGAINAAVFGNFAGILSGAGIIPAANIPPLIGQVVNFVFVQDASYQTTATTAGGKDTIMTNTDGGLFLTAPSITPKSASNKFLIILVAYINEDTNTASIGKIGVFRDATVNAVMNTVFDQTAIGAANAGIPIVLMAEVNCGSTAPTVFKMRAGVDVGQCDMNGYNGGRQGGAASFSCLAILEIQQ